MAGTDFLLEIQAYLSTKCGVTVGKTIFVDGKPDDTTGPSLFIIEMPGSMPDFTYSTNTIRKPRLRIEARSTAPAGGDYPQIMNARNLAQRAWDACLRCNNLTLHSTLAGSTGKWLSALPVQDVYLAGRDNRNRVVYAFDVDAMRMSG